MKRPIWRSSTRRARGWSRKRWPGSKNSLLAAFTTCPAIPQRWDATLPCSRELVTLRGHTRSKALIYLTFSHRHIIWRCWCGSDGAHEAPCPLPRRLFRGRNSPLRQVDRPSSFLAPHFPDRDHAVFALRLDRTSSQLDFPWHALCGVRLAIAGPAGRSSRTQSHTPESRKHAYRIGKVRCQYAPALARPVAQRPARIALGQAI